MQFKPRVRRRAVGLTSLIDVIFLLLLFFMLASSFTRYQALDVSSGGQGGGSATAPAFLRVHGPERLDLNGVAIAKSELADRFAALSEREGTVVAIWSGPGASVQDVVDVMTSARQSGVAAVLVTGK